MASTSLTKREVEVLRLICDGLTDREIAERLQITHHTADSHRKNMLKKLALKNTALLVRYACENGYVVNDLDDVIQSHNGKADDGTEELPAAE